MNAKNRIKAILTLVAECFAVQIAMCQGEAGISSLLLKGQNYIQKLLHGLRLRRVNGLVTVEAAIIGFPLKAFIFLSGMRLLPALAGMIAMFINLSKLY